MRKVLILYILIVYGNYSYCQKCDWALSAGGNNWEVGRKIKVDASGNIYIIGVFSDTLTLGSTTLISSGFNDIFIAKYNNAGTCQWAIKAGGKEPDEVDDLSIDSLGNIYITGSFKGTTSFGSIKLKSSGDWDVFVAKFNREGICQWAVKEGGKDDDEGSSITTDYSGNVYITGCFRGKAKFGTTSFICKGTDIFVAKYNNNGVCQWAVKAGGDYINVGNSIITDINGNIYITGSFAGIASFDTKTLISEGENDVFIAKYDNNGNIKWAVKAGGNNIDCGKSIVVDKIGNVYITGHFYDIATFGSTILSSPGWSDIFVAKYDEKGLCQWAVKAGRNLSDYGMDITLDSIGNVFVVGYIEYLITKNTISKSRDESLCADIHIGKYNTSGNLLWEINSKGNNYGIGNGITNDKKGNIYITGEFRGATIFGNKTLISSGNSDIFIVKFSDK